MSVIICDDRESNGAIPYIEAAIAANNKKYTHLAAEQGGEPITYSISRVTTGDYHILFKGNIYLTFERKTWKDLAASIKDQRMNRQHRQMENLSDQTGARLLYIIEGSKKGNDGKIGKISISTLETKLRRNFLRGSGYELSKSPLETAAIIVHYAREISRLVCAGENILSTPANNSYNTLYQTVVAYNKQLEELNNRFADQLAIYQSQFAEYIKTPTAPPPQEEGGSEPAPSEFGTQNPSHESLLTVQNVKTDSDVLELMWCTIKNVSEKTYPIISTTYKLRDLILVDLAGAKTIRDNIANMHYPGSKMKIGKKRADSIVLLGYNGKIESKQEESKKMAIKLLSQIPGVSEDTAKLVLNKYSLKQMCRGHVSQEDLSEITRENGRKIGKIGENIYKYFNANSEF